MALSTAATITLTGYRGGAFSRSFLPLQGWSIWQYVTKAFQPASVTECVRRAPLPSLIRRCALRWLDRYGGQGGRGAGDGCTAGIYRWQPRWCFVPSFHDRAVVAGFLAVVVALLLGAWLRMITVGANRGEPARPLQP